jgi:RNA polymerase sigma factor (sigma-70 family)
MGELSDVALWQRAVDGEPDAFGVLFRRHARSVYNYCFRRCGDWSEAEELTAIVFLEAWRRRKDVRLERENALPWLLGVATNVIRNARRARRRHRDALARVPRERVDDFAGEVDQRLDDERQARAVLRVLDRLPRTERDVLALSVGEGLSYEETALALGIPLGTVRSRLSRGRARLRELSPSDGHGWGATASIERSRAQ